MRRSLVQRAWCAALLACVCAATPVRAQAIRAADARPASAPSASAAPERDAGAVAAILARTPRELPRAAPERWAPFAGDPQRIASAVAPESRALLLTAREHYEHRDYAPALAALYQLLEREPDCPPALFVLSAVHYRLKRYGDARIALERYLEVLPGDVGRTQVLGHCLYGLGEYELARAHYMRVLAAEPESAEALRGLALCHMRLGEDQRALELLDQALALRPDLAEAHAFRAQILFETEQLEEALAASERARELEPYDPRAWHVAAQALAELGREDQAREARSRYQLLNEVAQHVRALEARLQLRPPDAYALSMQLAAAHARGGNAHGMRAAFQLAALLRPPGASEVQFRMQVLDLLEPLGSRELSHEAALELERVGAKDPGAWQRLQLYYQRSGDLPRALRAGDMWRRMTGADPGR